MKNLRSLALAALVVLPIAACDDDGNGTTTPPPAVGSVTGSVTVEGTPAPGITVTLAGQTTQTATTDSNGEFDFTGVEAGTYSVSLSNLPDDATFTNPTQQITINSDGQQVTADFTGNFIRTAAITGVVTVDEGGAPGVPVALGGTEAGATTTNDLGVFSFTGLRAGDYAVTITPPDEDVQFGQTTQNVTISVGETATVNFVGAVPKEPTVSLFSVTAGATNAPVNPTNVAGVIEFVINFDAGDETADRVSVWLDDGSGAVEAAWQQFSTTGGGGASASSDQLALSLVTNAFDAVTGAVDWLNGVYSVIVQMTTVEGSTVQASSSTDLTFNNQDIISVFYVSGGNRVVRNQVPFRGGGDITWGAQAIIYSADLIIDAIGVTAANPGGSSTTNGGQILDLGGGAGAEVIDTEAPFTYVSASADNDGALGVEALSTGPGFNINITSLLDPDGVDVLPSFPGGAITNLTAQYLDFVGPVTDGGAPGFATPSELRVGTTTIVAGSQWFSNGSFNTTNVTELGVGGVNDTYDVDDLATTGVDFVGVSAITDVPERVNTQYRLRLTGLTDNLGNVGDISGARGVTVSNVADDNVSEPIGADFGAPGHSAEQPAPQAAAPDPMNDPTQWFILNNTPTGPATTDPSHTIMYTFDEPTLADGTGGSGVSTGDLEFELDEVPTGGAAGPNDRTLTEASAEVTTSVALVAEVVGTAGVTAANMVTVTLQADGTGTASPDGAYVMTATTGDNAIAENENTTTWYIVLVTQPPQTEIINPPSDVTSSQSTLSFDIQGRVTAGRVDLDGDGANEELPLSGIRGTLRDPASTGTAGCEDTDTLLPLVGAGGNAVGNDTDVFNQIDVSEAPGFTRQFTLQNPNTVPGTTTQDICFFIEASGTELDKTGANDFLTSFESVFLTITWILN